MTVVEIQYYQHHALQYDTKTIKLFAAEVSVFLRKYYFTTFFTVCIPPCWVAPFPCWI